MFKNGIGTGDDPLSQFRSRSKTLLTQVYGKNNGNLSEKEYVSTMYPLPNGGRIGAGQ